MSPEKKRDNYYKTYGVFTSFEQELMKSAKSVSPKPAQKTYSCYEEERFDLVQTELALEMAKDAPNWVYAEALSREVAYWKQRWDDRKPVYTSIFDMWGFR